MKSIRFHLLLVIPFLMMFFSRANQAIAEGKDGYFETGIAAGSDLLHNLHTKQVLIAPAVNWEIKGFKSLWFRLEGDMEMIDDDMDNHSCGRSPHAEAVSL